MALAASNLVDEPNSPDAAIAVAIVGVLASAQEPLPDVAQLGPQVGETAPDFSLVDQFGERYDLQSVMGPNGLLLAFNRSADW